MRTPLLSGSMCLATMSMATLARYMLVPMPAVAVMPVAARTSEIMRMASCRGVRPYTCRYPVTSMKTSSTE